MYYWNLHFISNFVSVVSAPVAKTIEPSLSLLHYPANRPQLVVHVAYECLCQNPMGCLSAHDKIKHRCISYIGWRNGMCLSWREYVCLLMLTFLSDWAYNRWWDKTRARRRPVYQVCYHSLPPIGTQRNWGRLTHEYTMSWKRRLLASLNIATSLHTPPHTNTNT